LELVMLLIWRFITIVLVAMTMGLAFAHVFELPAKMLYDASLYMSMQRSLYAGWVPLNLSGMLEPAAIIASILLVIGVRRRRRAFWLSLWAVVALLAAFPLVYFLVVEPVNEIFQATTAVPANWTELRIRSELGNAIRFMLQLIALSLLLLSVLYETGKRKFMSDEF
jgi:hypothetical protein